MQNLYMHFPFAEQEQSRNLRNTSLTRIIHEVSAAAVDPGMSTALRSVGFLDVASSAPAESSRRVPHIHSVCAASLRNLVKNEG